MCFLMRNFFQKIAKLFFGDNSDPEIHGTAMGTAMAPTYANVFMAVLEKQMLQNAPNGLKPFEWIRFIDNIFALWTNGTETLNQFLNYINYIHQQIASHHQI